MQVSWLCAIAEGINRDKGPHAESAIKVFAWAPIKPEMLMCELFDHTSHTPSKSVVVVDM